jgi:two-component system sensor histidine kinase BarA
LLNNALKFTMKGSISVMVTFNHDTNHLIVSVTDTGIGISEEDQEKLFKVFGKLRASSSINTNGIGLGLNICRTICEVFEGEIYVKSGLNRGSTFTFSIKT